MQDLTNSHKDIKQKNPTARNPVRKTIDTNTTTTELLTVLTAPAPDAATPVPTI